MGVGSSRDPRDMMMPSGSSDRFVSEVFVILDTSVMRTHNAQQGPSGWLDEGILKSCYCNGLGVRLSRALTEQSIRIDTQIENARVKLTQAFQIIHREQRPLRSAFSGYETRRN